METLRQRLEEQKGRHQGGSKWIGTGGTSPFGAYGYNPEGVRIGQDKSRHRRAVKVWDQREFRDLDDGLELGTRNLKLALRRLRRFAREGAATELDMDGTIRATAHNAGSLDLKLVPERHNAVKVLLFLDVGGSMDDHVRVCEELFSRRARRVQAPRPSSTSTTARTSGLWQENRAPPRPRRADRGGDPHLRPRLPRGVRRRRHHEPLRDHPARRQRRALERRGRARSGCAACSAHWPRSAWLNPIERSEWNRVQSIGVMRRLLDDRMFPLTPAGLDDMIRAFR